MNRIFAILLAFLVLLSSAALAEAEPVDPTLDPAGDWYSSVEDVPVTLSLDPDGGYSFALPAALGAPQTGTWTLDDGFVCMNDGSALNLVNESRLIWTNRGLFFTREAPALYAPADLMEGATLELYAGYWKCVYVDADGVALPAEALGETTDLYIDGATVALGGPRFGDIFWTFDFADGALTADVNGQRVNLALQQDGFLRLTLPDAALCLQPVITEEAEAE